MALTGWDLRLVLTLPDGAALQRGMATDGNDLYTALEPLDDQANFTDGLYCLSPQRGTAAV